MTSTLVPSGHILPFALHNPHPEFELPIAQYVSAYTRKGRDIQRKRTSLASSETSSELSTPSAPPLTDDDESMSDPEFVLDAQLDTTAARPTFSYARRPSTTNTRSTTKHVAPSASSSTSGASTSHSAASTRSRESGQRTPSRTRRSRDAFTLLEDINKLVYSDERDRRRHTEHIRPQSFRIHRRSHHEEEEERDDSNRVEDLDASYATLTKLSVAAKAAETIRSPKSRRPPTHTRPRASLPAYFSLTKISKPSFGGFAWDGGAFTAPQDLGSRASKPLHKTSPTVACSELSASNATLFGNIRKSAATVAQTIHTGSPPSSSSQLSPRHSICGTGGIRPDSPSSKVSDVSKVRTPETSRLATPSNRASAAPQVDDEFSTQMASGLRQASALDALCDRTDGGCSGTPRGRTRSRSNRPRSRSRSRTRERVHRAHFGGSPVLRDSAAMTSRGRPHAKGAHPFSRGRRERKDLIDHVGQVQQRYDEMTSTAQIDWLDVRDDPEPVPERPRRSALLLS